MQKILFSLAESKTPQGESLDNIYVIAAINHGDAYDIDIEITDIALKRRFAFIEFMPKKDNFKIDKLHPMLKEVTEFLTKDGEIIDTNLKDGDAVFEQATTYGSWASYSTWLRETEAEKTFLLNKKDDDGNLLPYKLTYQEAADDLVLTAGKLFFKGETTNRISEILFMLENTKSFNFTEIIANGKINVNHWGEGKYGENDLVIRTYFGIKRHILDDLAYLSKTENITRKDGSENKQTNFVNLLQFLSENKKTSLFLSLLAEINGEILREKEEAKRSGETNIAKLGVKQRDFARATVSLMKFIETSKDKELRDLGEKVRRISDLNSER